MYRQGDVLLIPVKSIPKGANELPRDNGRVVLAYGEVTGHAHAFSSGRATMFREDGSGGGGGTFLLVKGGAPAALRHEEHTTVKVPPGNYEVRRQREYTPERLRQVAD